MRFKALSTLFLGLALGVNLFAQADENPYDSSEIIERQDSVPPYAADTSGEYLEGYLQALIDMHYYDYKVLVKVKGHEVYLYNLPANKLTAGSILAFAQDFPGVTAVHPIENVPPEVVSELKPSPIALSKDNDENKRPVQAYMEGGVWLPQTTVLFQPLVADPRQITYSAGYRWNDTISKKIIAVSFGDEFPIYRWRDVWPMHGDMQIDIDGGVWAIFDLAHTESSTWADLINADYYVGIPVTYAYGNWSYRFRLYHRSCHLGDEYMIANPGVTRYNVSYEAIDFVASYQLTDAVRFYGGLGHTIHNDEDFPVNPFYFIGGTELRLLGHKLYYNQLYGQPFLAMNFYLSEGQGLWHFSGNYLIGYEWSKLQGIGRKMRLYFQYYNGLSMEGQFQNQQTAFFSITFSYGF